MMMRWLVPAVLVCVAAFPLYAQESAGSLTGHSFSAGGIPNDKGQVLTSTHWIIRFGIIGSSVSLIGGQGDSGSVTAGYGLSFPSAEEVNNVTAITRTVFEWDRNHVNGPYNVYRGPIAELPTGYGEKTHEDLPLPNVTDPEEPPPWSGFFYLMTATSRLGVEGTLGFRSDGTQRQTAALP